MNESVCLVFPISLSYTQANLGLLLLILLKQISAISIAEIHSSTD